MIYTRSSWAPLALRLILGFGFIYHGFPKLFSAAGHQGFQGMLQGMGLPAPSALAYLVGAVEVFGGLALIIGAFTSIAAALLIIEMMVAMFMVHLPQGFNFLNITGMTDAGPTFGMPGYEVPLLYIAGLLALALGGPGAYSVDQGRAERRRGAVERSPRDVTV